MKLRLDVGHQEPATLFSFPAKRYVSRVIHSTRNALIDHFVPHRLGFNHISRQDVIDLHTCPLATNLLADQAGPCHSDTRDGTYIYFQKSANNLLQRQTSSLHQKKTTDENNTSNGDDWPYCFMYGTLLFRLKEQ